MVCALSFLNSLCVFTLPLSVYGTTGVCVCMCGEGEGLYVCKTYLQTGIPFPSLLREEVDWPIQLFSSKESLFHCLYSSPHPTSRGTDMHLDKNVCMVCMVVRWFSLMMIVEWADDACLACSYWMAVFLDMDLMHHFLNSTLCVVLHLLHTHCVT